MADIIVFTFGAVMGSFLNVCIYRIPRKISLLNPGSFCPQCGIHIPFYYNIPLVSFLWLKGRCHRCHQRISVRYPVIELLAAMLTSLSYHKFGFSASFFFYTGFIYSLMAISFIDWSTRLIPNKLLVWTLAYGIVLNGVFRIVPWGEAVAGLIVGTGLMLVFAFLGYGIFRKESLGMGDVKFAGVAGFFLGWKVILFAVFSGFFLAFLFVVPLMASKKLRAGEYIPLGPFIAIAFIMFVYWGSTFMNWYWQFVLQGMG